MALTPITDGFFATLVFEFLFAVFALVLAVVDINRGEIVCPTGAVSTATVTAGVFVFVLIIATAALVFILLVRHSSGRSGVRKRIDSRYAVTYKYVTAIFLSSWVTNGINAIITCGDIISLAVGLLGLAVLSLRVFGIISQQTALDRDQQLLEPLHIV